MYSQELKDQVIRYIDNEISLRELEEWIVPRTPMYIHDPESDDADLIAEIELQLAEFADGLRDEGNIKDELERLFIQRDFIEVWFKEPTSIVTTGTSDAVYSQFFFEIVSPLTDNDLELISFNSV